MRKVLAAATVAGLVAFACPVVAHAAPATKPATKPALKPSVKPPQARHITVRHHLVEPGDVIAISGAGCHPGTQVVFRLGSKRIGQATANRHGAFVGLGRIPRSTAPGKFVVSARCNNHFLAGTSKIRVRSPYPGHSPHGLAVSRSAVAAGGTVSLNGAGCDRGEAAVATLDGTGLASARAGATGAFSASATIPAQTAAGLHTIAASCGGAPNGAATIRVVDARPLRTLPASAPLGGRIAGGGAPLALLLAAASLAGLAALSLAAMRRRRSRQA